MRKFTQKEFHQLRGAGYSWPEIFAAEQMTVTPDYFMRAMDAEKTKKRLPASIILFSISAVLFLGWVFQINHTYYPTVEIGFASILAVTFSLTFMLYEILYKRTYKKYQKIEKQPISDEQYKRYIQFLGDTYFHTQMLPGDAHIQIRTLDMTDEDIQKLSYMELAEIWRLYMWAMNEYGVDKDLSDEEKKKKIEYIGAAIVRKIMNADEIYTIYSKKTGAPYLFSRTIHHEDTDQYECTPPDIAVFPYEYLDHIKSKAYDDFEIRKIENGEDKRGIGTFLKVAFYQDGACGIAVLGTDTKIDKSRIIALPDFSKKDPGQIPVLNPDLERWILVISQLDDDSKAAPVILGLLYKELPKAQFYVPIKLNVEKNKITTLHKGDTIDLQTITLEDGRNAVTVYTDMTRAQKKCGEHVYYMTVRLQDIFDKLDGVTDVVINATNHPAEAKYISKEMFKKATALQQAAIGGDQHE